MDPSLRSAAKQLAAQYLKANPDYKSSSDHDQKAKLRKEIELKRAHCAELQQLISALVILNNGVRVGAETSNVRDALLRETQDTVHAIMQKHNGLMKTVPRQLQQARSGLLQTHNDKKMEDQFREVIHNQGLLFDSIRRSRAFQVVEHAKNEALKAQQMLNETEGAIQQARETFVKESEQMRKEFAELAVQIGEEQERLQQERAQPDSRVLRQELCVGSTASAFNGVEQTADGPTVSADPGAHDEQQPAKQKDCAVGVAGLGMNFSNIEHDFPIGLTFKNPNDFPEILHRISSPRDYEALVQNIEKSAPTVDQSKHPGSGEVNENRRGTMFRNPEPVVDVKALSIHGSTPPSPKKLRKTPEDVPRQQGSSTERSRQNGKGEHERGLQYTRNVQNESTKENVAAPAAQPTPTKSKGKEKPLFKRAPSPRCIDGGAPAKLKRSADAATTVPQNQPPPHAVDVVGAHRPSSPEDIFMDSPKAVHSTDLLPKQKPQPAVVPSVKPRAVQKPGSASPEPDATMQQRAVSISRTRRSARVPPVTPAMPDVPAATSRTRKRQQPSSDVCPPSDRPDGVSSGAHSIPDDAMDGLDESNQLKTAQACSSVGSLDFALASSSNEFDANLSLMFPNINFDESGGIDLTADLDFLMSNTSSRAADAAANQNKSKADATEAGDSFSFDFDGQNSTGNIGDQSGPDDIF